MSSDLNKVGQKKEFPFYLLCLEKLSLPQRNLHCKFIQNLHFFAFATVHSYLWTSKWKLKIELKSHFHKKRKEGFLPSATCGDKSSLWGCNQCKFAKCTQREVTHKSRNRNMFPPASRFMRALVILQK